MIRSELTLEDVLDFGAHRGKQVEDLIEDHPDYISWLIEEGVVGFDNEACELITKKGIM